MIGKSKDNMVTPINLRTDLRKGIELKSLSHYHRHRLTSTSSISMNFIILFLLLIQMNLSLTEPLSSEDTTEYSLISKSTSVTSNSIKGSSIISSKIHNPTTKTSKVIKRAGSLSDVKSKKISDENGNNNNSNSNSNTSQEIQNQQQLNRSREALSHEGSERETVVYLSDSPGYVPVNSYRSGSRPSHQSSSSGSGSSSISSPSGSGGSGGSYNSGSNVDLDTWRPDPWDRDYTKRPKFNNTRVQHIEAECQDDYMKIRIGFNGSFNGLLYSAGYAYDPDCMYINGSGRDYYEFYIQLNRCGTLGKNALHDDNRKNPTNFMWNTITVQYNPLIEEEFDEHFKVTCEYGYDFWKTVTFPFLDVEVATGNPVVFTLSPPECYMEIRNGYGIAGTRVTGPVRVGDPLTLIIYMRSKYDGFDIVVNDCYAHNGAQKRIQLIDEYGCPVDDKLISRFRGAWSDSGVYETQVYAYMKTFRFTGSPALYIECDVRMCHGRCPSQPCHWRNLKTVSKREISNNTINSGESSTAVDDIKESSQSENINLFQSLRVLQEGEEDEDEFSQSHEFQLNHETCIRTTVLSALSATFSLLLCILLALLIITYSKLRYKKKERKPYNTYFTHKGQQID